MANTTQISDLFRIAADIEAATPITVGATKVGPNGHFSSEPSPRQKVPPEILEWARQTFDEEEFLAHVREIEKAGGVQLEDFIAEIEARAKAK